MSPKLIPIVERVGGQFLFFKVSVWTTEQVSAPIDSMSDLPVPFVWIVPFSETFDLEEDNCRAC
jgi:hypothetical protein